MPEETEDQEKSVDEKVGDIKEISEAILSKVLERVRASGDTSRIDEFIEDRYDKDNYEQTILSIARRKSDVATRVTEIAALNKFPVGLAGWAVGKGFIDKDNDPSKHIAAATGLETKENLDAEIYKSIGIASQRLAKTLNISVPDAGGVLTVGTRVDDFFAPLREQSVVMRFGPMVRGIVDGAITVTGMETDVAIIWGQEVNLQEIQDEPTWGDRDRPTNHARVLVPVSNAALRSTASQRILSDIDDSIRHAFAIGFDTAWINATGAQFRPKGLRESAGTTTNSGGDSFNQIVDDAKGAMLRMSQNNVPMRNLGWLMSKRERIELEFLRDVNDLFPFRTEVMNGTWFGAQLESTGEVSTTEGGGTESFVLLTDFSGVLIGTGSELRINTWNQGSYTVGGQQRNPIERDESVIVAHAETALLVAQPEHIEEIDQVTWGA